MKYKALLAFILALAVFLAYGNTLRMYFWEDDNGYIFKLQNPYVEAGPYGPDLVGSGPYKYQATFAFPFYQFFQLNPVGYFAYGLVMYFVAALSVYFLAANFLENRRTAYMAALIFASGLVGAESLFRITNTYQTSAAIILASLSFGLLFKNLFYGGISNYLLSVLFFLLAVEFVQIRSHGLVFCAVVAILLFSQFWKSIKELLITAIKIFPFLFIFNRYYLYLGSGSIVTSEGSRFISDVFYNGHFEYIFTILSIFSNLLLPDLVVVEISRILSENLTFVDGKLFFASLVIVMFCLLLYFEKLIFSSSQKVFALVLSVSLIWYVVCFLAQFNNYQFFQNQFNMIQVLIGGLFFINVVYLISISVCKNDDAWRKIVFCILWVVFSFLAFLVHSPLNVLSGTHRYLSLSLVGWSILLAILLAWIVKFARQQASSGNFFNRLLLMIGNKFTILGLGLILTANIYLNYNLQTRIVDDRSIPTANFFSSLQKILPKVNKRDAFFFNVQNDDLVSSRFNNFFAVGSMPPTTALAIYYHLDRYDIKLLPVFDELASLVAAGQIGFNQIHTFSYDRQGLVDTTGMTTAALGLGGQTKLTIDTSSQTQYKKINDTIIGYTPPLIINLEKPISATSPLEVTWSLKLAVDYSVADSQYHQTNKTDDLQRLVELEDVQARPLSNSDRRLIFNYLVAKKEYQKNSKAQSSSSWKYHEVENINDGRPETDWLSHIGKWHELPYEEIVIDLGKIKNISKVVWVNGYPQRTPTVYQIEVSQDRTNWQKVASVTQTAMSLGATKQDSFTPHFARYVKMAISATAGDSPQIAEMEVVEERFRQVNLDRAKELIATPFMLGDGKDFAQADNFVKNGHHSAKIYWKSAGDADWKNVQSTSAVVYADGRWHDYSLIIPVDGTRSISQIKIDNLMFPSQAYLAGISFKYLTLSDLVNRRLIRKFNDN